MDTRDALQKGALALGVNLTPENERRLLLLVDELLKWNAAYNLTAITRRDDIVTHHLLDTLVTVAPKKDRSVEAAKARERSAKRFPAAVDSVA